MRHGAGSNTFSLTPLTTAQQPRHTLWGGGWRLPALCSPAGTSAQARGPAAPRLPCHDRGHSRL